MWAARIRSVGDGRPHPRLHHVTVQVPSHSVVACLNFYQEILGLSSVKSPIQKTSWFEQGIHLYWGDDKYREPVEAGPQHFALIIGKHYDSVVASCKKLECYIEEGTQYWGSPRCYVMDPVCNRIELMQSAP